MNNFNNVNITIEDVLTQRELENRPKTNRSTFDVKNYLQARLGKDETAKTLIIRLLPFKPEGGSPFEKVHFHNVMVNKSVAPSGWKQFPCPVRNHLGDKCPFCELTAQAEELRKHATNEVDKKKYDDIIKANFAKNMWIVRCIERGHEEDGVKFWLFPDSKKKDGVYDKIYSIFKNRYLKAKEQGRVNNIFDLNEGKDLFINLTKDSNGKTVINITDDDEKTPLSTDYELAQSWVNDTKKWTEVYTIKPYEYMSIILQGGKPIFDKEHNKYVDKFELDKQNDAEIEANLTHTNKDLSVSPNSNQNETNNNSEGKNNQEENVLKNVFVNTSNFNDEDDDLPF